MYSNDPYNQDGKPGPFSPASPTKGTQAGKPMVNRYGPYYAAAEAYGQRNQGPRNFSPYGDFARGPMQRGPMPMQRPMQPMQPRPPMGMRRPGFGGVSPQNPYGNGGGY